MCDITVLLSCQDTFTVFFASSINTTFSFLHLTYLLSIFSDFKCLFLFMQQKKQCQFTLGALPPSCGQTQCELFKKIPSSVLLSWLYCFSLSEVWENRAWSKWMVKPGEEQQIRDYWLLFRTDDRCHVYRSEISVCTVKAPVTHFSIYCISPP